MCNYYVTYHGHKYHHHTTDGYNLHVLSKIRDNTIKIIQYYRIEYY